MQCLTKGEWKLMLSYAHGMLNKQSDMLKDYLHEWMIVLHLHAYRVQVNVASI